MMKMKKGKKAKKQTVVLDFGHRCRLLLSVDWIVEQTDSLEVLLLMLLLRGLNGEPSGKKCKKEIDSTDQAKPLQAKSSPVTRTCITQTEALPPILLLEHKRRLQKMTRCHSVDVTLDAIPNFFSNL